MSIAVAIPFVPEAGAGARNKGGPRNPMWLTDFEDKVFFSALGRGQGRELWRSDGTSAGTFVLKNINRNGDSDPMLFTPAGRRFFFIATDDRGPGLWKSNGTARGTRLVKRFPQPPGEMVAVGDRVFFRGKEKFKGTAFLYVSDGTRSSTVRVNPPEEMSDPMELASIGDVVYFAGRNSESDVELWRSDGTNEGTYEVKDINQVGGGSHPYAFTPLDDLVIFNADGELWRTDGTADGTILVRDINPAGESDPFGFTRLEDFLYFRAIVGDGYQLWRTDGTPAGTTQVGQLPLGGSLAELTRLGDAVYFVLTHYDAPDYDEVTSQLWRSDGTDAGTTMVQQFGPARSSQYVVIETLTALGDLLYFDGYDKAHGSEPWVSDGTTEGTKLLKDACPGRCSGGVGGFTMAHGIVFFSGGSELGRPDTLWRTKGTEASTRPVIP